jgi:death-on-curing family protein
MDFLHPDIEKEYLRWTALLGVDDPYTSRDTVGLHEVLRAHFLIVDFFVEQDYGVGGIGPKNIDLLHSSIYRQFVSFGGKDKWPGIYEKCATLLFGLVKDHPFHDANKRTAFLVTLYQLYRLNRTPRASQRDFEDFIVEVADNRLARYPRFRELAKEKEDAEILFIADFLKRNTRDIDRRTHTITYHELNQILKKHGFELVNQHKNFIDIVRVEHKPKYLGLVGPTVRREYRLGQVGFPGWKRQIGKGALKTVRDATGLTAQSGYDSKTFFDGADPLHVLIDMYSEPLRRLADR